MEALPPDWVPPVRVAVQKLPNPWVGQTGVSPASALASCRAEACCAAARVALCAGPSRSGHPVEPCSSEPPVNTAATRPAAVSSSA
jgi:hypothetical protein